MTGKDSARGILVGGKFSFVTLFVSRVALLESNASEVASSQLLYFLALFLQLSECIGTNAQSAKRPEQRPDSFVGKGVLSNVVAKYIPRARRLRFIQLECSAGRKYVTSFTFFH